MKTNFSFWWDQKYRNLDLSIKCETVHNFIVLPGPVLVFTSKTPWLIFLKNTRHLIFIVIFFKKTFFLKTFWEFSILKRLLPKIVRLVFIKIRFQDCIKVQGYRTYTFKDKSLNQKNYIKWFQVIDVFPILCFTKNRLKRFRI